MCIYVCMYVCMMYATSSKFHVLATIFIFFSHQVTVDHMCDLRKENDDLKGTVETLEDVKRDAGTRRDNLQKENDVLEQHITELQEEVRS